MDRDERPDALKPTPVQPHAPQRGTGGPTEGPVASPTPTLLDRAVSFLRGLARAVLRLGAAALVGGLAIWWAVLQGTDPGENRTGILVVLAILLAAPPIILFLFVVALRTLIGLPQRIRETPGAVGDRLAEIRQRMARLSEARREGALAALRSFFRLGWSIATSREVVEISPAVVLLTPGMLVATVFAAAAALLEILLGAGAVLWLVLS